MRTLQTHEVNYVSGGITGTASGGASCTRTTSTTTHADGSKTTTTTTHCQVNTTLKVE